MTYNKVKIEPLIMFIVFLIGMFLVMFVGVNEVFALNNDSPYVKMFDNYGSSLTEVTTNKVTSPTTHWTATIPTIVANSNGGAIIIQTETPLAKNVNYSISIFLSICKSDFSDCYNPAISSKPNLGIGTGVQLTKDSYFDNTAADVITKEVTGNYVYYNFTTKTNGSYILIPFTSITSCSGGCIVDYYGYDLVSNGLASDLTQQEITNITTNQTNELNQSIQNSTDTITGEIDDMEQSIIDSNKETQDVIKDQFNTCRDSYNLIDTKDSLTLNGLNITRNKDHTFTLNGTRDTFIGINVVKQVLLPAGTYNLSVLLNNAELQADIYYENNGEQVYLYKKNSDLTFTIDGDSTILSINPYFSARTYNNEILSVQLVSGTSKKPYETYGEEICSNKIDETNDKLNNIEDTLTDSSAPNTSGLENSAGWLPPGPLDSVLNLPLSLFNSLTTNLNKSCSSISIPLPYVNKNITLPCINTLYNQIGITSFLSWIGVIVSGLMLYSYLLKLYKWIEDRISLNETHNVDSWGGL